MRVRDHSDFNNTDNPAASSTSGRRMAWFRVDAEGYACGGWTWQGGEGEGKDSHLFLKATAQPIDPADVVLPSPFWPLDADGRGRSVMEVYGAHYLLAEQRTLARHVTEYMRRAA